MLLAMFAPSKGPCSGYNLIHQENEVLRSGSKYCLLLHSFLAHVDTLDCAKGYPPASRSPDTQKTLFWGELKRAKDKKALPLRQSYVDMPFAGQSSSQPRLGCFAGSWFDD